MAANPHRLACSANLVIYKPPYESDISTEWIHLLTF